MSTLPKPAVEVVTQVDKFGRILVPKSLRDDLQLLANSKVKLVLDETTSTIQIVPLRPVATTIKVHSDGWMTLGKTDATKQDLDVVKMIADDREERARKVWGDA